jgi:hypothetical protein
MMASETTPLVAGVDRKGCGGLNDVEKNGTTIPDLKQVSSSSSSCSSSSSSLVVSSSPTSLPVLVEMIGVRNLPLDSNMECYCVIQYGTKIIHRTQPFVAKATKTEQVSRMFQVFGTSAGTGSIGSGIANTFTASTTTPVATTPVASNSGSNTFFSSSSPSSSPQHQQQQKILQCHYQNPIWTVQHDAVFSCLVQYPHDLQNHKALTIQVWVRPIPVSVTRRALQMVATTALLLGPHSNTTTNYPTHPDVYHHDHDDHEEDSLDHVEEDEGEDRHQTFFSSTKRLVPSPPQQEKSSIRNYTNQNKPQFIGKVRIPAPTLLNNYCTERRIEITLQDDLGRIIKQPDTNAETVLAIRCRMASPADLHFAQTWSKLPPILMQQPSSPVKQPQQQDSMTQWLLQEAQVLQEPHRVRATLVTELPEWQVQGATLSSAMVGSISSSSPTNHRDTVKVKPYPDPFSPETTLQTRYLTRSLLKTLTKAPSRRWIQVGSLSKTKTTTSFTSSLERTMMSTISISKYGRLYVEILSAHGLPNVDYGQRLGNQTDTFCTLIYGDGMVQTDIIDDELSPHWLPWTQRAFCFALGHPSQVLYVGVFGYKRAPMRHAPIGRIEINTTNLQHDTLYELHYDLISRSHKYNGRISNGTLRVRVRVELDNERRYLLASLQPPPPVYINVAKRKSMYVARYTAMGEYDTQDKFQLAVLQGYIDEILQGYVRRILYGLQDGLRSLFLWKNQITVEYQKYKIHFGFPLYSLLAFTMSLLALEIPTLIPSMMTLGLALFMLVHMQLRIYNNPSPLRRCFSFWYYLRILVTGKTPIAFQEIKPNHGRKELEAMNKKLEERVEKDREFFDKKEAVEKMIEEIKHERVTTRTNAIPIELMVVLGKVQGIVGDVCRVFRFLDTLITWEESDHSFFITLFLILGGIVMFFIPWAFLFTWTGRIVVVLLLGPQNKILDMVYFRHVPTDEQKIRQLFMERMFQA